MTGTGFTPNEPLVVVQCADRGNATGQGDCNLSAVQMTVSDGSGRVSAVLNVTKGPFGANHRSCGGRHRCLVSVSQEALNPSEEADAPITFAGR